MKSYDKCIVKWIDVIASNEWEKHSEIECPEFETIGWLIDDGDKTVKIANTLDYFDFEDKNSEKPIPYGITAFPRGCVLNITLLKEDCNTIL